jgi:hypothetical protein
MMEMTMRQIAVAAMMAFAALAATVPAQADYNGAGPLRNGDQCFHYSSGFERSYGGFGYWGRCRHKASATAETVHTSRAAKAQSQFDGTWTVSRSPTTECPDNIFKINILTGVVEAPGGSGLVSASGNIRFPGRNNQYTGRLRDSTGSGTYAGKCFGSFSVSRS